ncbi:type II toxin-antitoxin system VapC family toxin [Arcanobacterium bovis]|uniref:Ribonuclease VapC n=1 Tax=Arcanobacterium bovis TaxID=2529275 RepID=A0A4Q9V2U4_9ACTO|nr:type II toxin-antitoxin system VapC family toxin [Arcanobacterium bovis]TBW22897.1 type II toxin-antitoxin system VapC family toxin [Arcanobacterium bovis]
MKYLLDTNVISALRRPEKNQSVFDWAKNIPPEDTYICSLTAAEIGRGIKAIAAKDELQARVLTQWFEGQVLPAFSGRILSFDLDAALIFRNFEVPAKAPIDDAYIAAIAQAHGLTVVSRNTKHFLPLGIDVVSP